jgi:hypothetical protein
MADIQAIVLSRVLENIAASSTDGTSKDTDPSLKYFESVAVAIQQGVPSREAWAAAAAAAATAAADADADADVAGAGAGASSTTDSAGSSPAGGATSTLSLEAVRTEVEVPLPRPPNMPHNPPTTGNTGELSIATRIHQTWKTSDLPDRMKQWSQSWQKLHR